MSESVEILISAEDQASVKVSQAAENVVKAEKKVDAVVKSLQSPLERYENQLKELEELHKSGVLSAEKYAIAQQAIADKIDDSSNAYKEVGGQAKSATEFVGTLANLAGGSELAGLASQMAEVTDRVGNFSEVAKGGKGSALAFKAGLVALVATLAIQVGKAIGDIVFETEKFNKALEHTKERAAELTDAVAANRDQLFAETKEDIELIRDPEAKQAAYAELLDQLNRDVSAVSANVRKSQRDVEEWAGSWKITGERKASAEMAETELENDLARLKALREMRDEIISVTGARAAENAEIARKNELAEKSDAFIDSLREELEYLQATKEEQIKLNAERNTTPEAREEAEQLLRERDAINAKKEAEQAAATAREQLVSKSSEYLESLRQEIEYLKATKEEQIKLDAARNTTSEDRGEAEQLLRERDAIQEKIKAEEELERTRKKAAEEQQREAERAREASEKEAQKVEDIIQREERRLRIKQIEIEQGKEAAKVQSLVDQGVDREKAEQLAAKEAALDSASKKDGAADKSDSNKQANTLQSQESRLLVRGKPEQLQEKLVAQSEQSNKILQQIAERLKNQNEKPPVDGSQKIKVIR